MRFQVENWALVAAILFQAVNAGAAANIQACIYRSQKPAEKYNISWTAGGASDHCMHNTGNNALMEVSDGGLTCQSVGYVYHKASSSDGDLCATDQSVWGLSYNGGKNNVYSGSTLTYWESAGAFLSKGHVWLVNQSKDTKICPSKARCDSDDIWWSISDTPDVYIIFQSPLTSAGNGVGEEHGEPTGQGGELR